MLNDRDSQEARQIVADAVQLATTPVKRCPDLRVRLARPEAVEPGDPRFRRQYARRCNVCGSEYRWFYHAGEDVIFAVCPGLECGRGYFPIGPAPKGMTRQLSEDRVYRGTKARKSWATYRRKTRVIIGG